MNKLNSKLDKKGNPPQYKPSIHPGRNRGCGQRQNRYTSRDRSYSRGRGPYNNNNRKGEIFKIRTIMVLEIIEIGTTIPRIIDPIIESKILAKGMTKDLDIEVSVENVTDPDQGIGVPQEKTLKIDIEIIRRERQRSRTTSIERGTRSRSRSSSQVRTSRDRLRSYRCNEYDHFARECPNIMSDEEQVENLQMLLPEEQTMVLNYSETEDLNL